MATGSIKTTKTQSGGFTPNGSVTANNLLIKQSGNVVFVGGYLSNVSAGSTVRLGTFTGIKAPNNVLRFLCGVADQAYQHPQDVAYCTIGTDLSLSINSTASGTKAVYFNVTWIVA